MARSATRPRLEGRRRTPLPFEIAPDDAARAALAAELGVTSIRKLRFAGELIPEGRVDWRLEATLGATIVQPCGITLEPVTTRIDETVRREYREELAERALPEEQEMPDDDEAEPLPAVLDLEGVMAEALVLALPAFPRAPGADLGAVETADPGAAPIPEEHDKPFANLKDLLGKGS